MNVGETREALREWTSLWREKKSGVELQTCLHLMAEIAVLCPELEDGTRGDVALTFIWRLSLKSNCEMNVFNIASGQGFMEWRNSCAGDIT